MSKFPNQANALKQLYDEMRAIKARLSSVITPAGKLRVTQLTLQGGIWSHDHTDTENGGHPEYTPALLSTWTGNQDPGDVWAALDQLALRLKAVEDLMIGIPPIVYPSSTMMFNGIEA